MRSEVSSYVIFTDLDGTLLDHESYSYQPAMPAIEVLRERSIPLVFCTSKTRAEVEEARQRLGNQDPFIVENGAAVFIPRSYFPFPVAAWKHIVGYHIIQLGIPYAEVVDTLRRAAVASQCPVRGFHEMSAEEVAERCGMSLPDAERAKRREYDEPFEVLTESPALIGGLLNRIEEEGFTWTRGGRFYHIRGRHNKGEAARKLIALFRRRSPGTVTVGLGDGPNDISLLETVDVPILIPARSGKRVHVWKRPGLSLRMADQHGPRGWNQAVLSVIN